VPKGELSRRWLVPPGRPVRLAAIEPDSTAGAPGGGDRDETAGASAELNGQLADLQERLWAEGTRALLVVLQAMDTGGKDGTIKRVFGGVNPQGVRVVGFKAPTPDELAHDFLWRAHKATPARGEIAIFNRSHYEDVLIVRVHGWITPEVCRERYEAINAFERTLTANGTRVVKVMLHISKDEQAERLRKRLDKPEKRWKFNPTDLDERKRWDDYQRAYEDAVGATSTVDAPWYVVPADRKWYRDWAVLTIIVEALRAMDPQYPEPADDLSGITIE
jgi:PPK2 family polyphosphate:nucleotide phosphotransferase